MIFSSTHTLLDSELMKHTICILCALGLLACSKKQSPEETTPTNISTSTQETTPTTTAAKEDAPPETAIAPEGATTIDAKAVEGPFASLAAFAEANGAEVVRADPGSSAMASDWLTEGGVIKKGDKARHVLLAGKAGKLFAVSGEQDIAVDIELSTPDQYKGAAKVIEEGMPEGFVAFVDETQSGTAHDVTGHTHLCHEREGGLVCAKFTTHKGAYLVYDQAEPSSTIARAALSAGEGPQVVEVKLDKENSELSKAGTYFIALPQ